MTFRRGQCVGVTPEDIADLLREPALRLLPDPGTANGIFDPTELRVFCVFFDEFTEQVVALGRDQDLVLRVAELIGVSPADWYRQLLTTPASKELLPDGAGSSSG